MAHGFLGISPAEYEKAVAVSREILTQARNGLRLHLRSFSAAMDRLETAVHGDIVFATDGSALYYEPLHLLEKYRKEPDVITRDYLHVLLHCLLRHPFLHTRVERMCWDLACDIAVEAAISALELDSVTTRRQKQQQTVVDELRSQVKHLTAEKLYRHFLEHPPEKQNDLRVLFRADDHGLWYQERNPELEKKGGGQTQRDWEQIARHIQGDLETFSRHRGAHSAGLLQNLTAVNRERYDYAAFLSKFAVRNEVMQLDPDEFDYIFYTYGLKLYDRIPLIEPLEYREQKQIREFAVAIDTSGSVRGELVQAFVQKTYNILKQTESFASKINLHIIQCDQEIQEDVKITTREEFDAYLASMTLRGFGGTDFRPVFSYVEQLRRKGEFLNLKGLIYFTDGLGIYPEQKTDYDTAFVFLDEDYSDPEVPPWAMKLILESEAIL